jgi:hypothetical protein
MNQKYIALIILVLLIVISGCISTDPMKNTCDDLGGKDWSAMKDCPEGTDGVRAKDSCKSCQCCIPIDE